MNIKDILKNAGFTLLIFSLVVAMALMAKNGDIIVWKNENALTPNYNIENVTKLSHENDIYLPDNYMDSDVWDENYDESPYMVIPFGKDDEYFTESFNEITEGN